MSLDKLKRFALSALVAAVVCSVMAVIAPASQTDRSNNKCYVCHPGLKTEDVTVNHLAMGITCDTCHGPCVEHMHDEMLMTTPDLLFGRSEVRRMCSNRACHTPGGDRKWYTAEDHKNPAAVNQFQETWFGRVRPNGRAISRDAVCTDCHGTHNLDKTEKTGAEQEQDQAWQALFNGTDLTGWTTDAKAVWKVERGRIRAVLTGREQRANLWTQGVYQNYQLAVTFRADWPIQAGLWLRAGKPNRGPRLQIGAVEKQDAFTGSIRLANGTLALVNYDADLVDRGGWNTLAVKAEAKRVQVWLNGEEIGALRLAGPTKGRIGFHLQGGAGEASLEVREVLLKPLTQTDLEHDSAANP